jgi:hypothetical protein
MERVCVWVPGNPVTLTAPATVADPWKRAVAEAVRSEWKSGFLHAPCAVYLAFFLTRDRYPATAIFNLLKATTDGLSHVVFGASPSGQPGPWSREDFWITQLVAEKRMADGEPGVTIEMRSPSSDFTRCAMSPVVEGFIPGSPPLWPGDKAGQQKVLEWRRRVERVLRPSMGPDPQTRLAITLRFQIEPGRMNTSDLDNFCVPASQAVVNALFGDFSHVAAVEKIAAEKVATSPDQYGIRVQVQYV